MRSLPGLRFPREHRSSSRILITTLPGPMGTWSALFLCDLVLRKTRRTAPFPPTMYRPSLVYLSVVFASRSVLADFFCKYTFLISFLCFSCLVGDQVGLGLNLHADCKTIAVQSGDGCASLAARCGLSGNTFMFYNPKLDCSKLVVDQVSDLLV